ncbi:MAG TPA: hypothetical protein VK483_04470 [Chitinophagaceae bacterium]|nr:hypothetical protein [Chitinophagaceae bacterium]
MRPQSLTRFSLLAVIIFALFSCNEKEEYNTDKLSDYIVLTPGKYITYRIDSMVFTNFGRTTEIHRYQVKHVIDAQVPDNLGRPSYRVYVYIRDSAGLQPWQPAGNTYFITPLADQMELIENNLRFIKMHLPIKDAFSWRGNTYLPTDPYGSVYNFSNDNDMVDWDFHYDGNPSSFSYRGMNYADVLTVEEADNSFNIPITPSASYAARSRAVEKYSKNIGLVYREYELWEYQQNTGNPAGPYKIGFGITMWMIDHN